MSTPSVRRPPLALRLLRHMHPSIVKEPRHRLKRRSPHLASARRWGDLASPWEQALDVDLRSRSRFSRLHAVVLPIHLVSFNADNAESIQLQGSTAHPGATHDAGYPMESECRGIASWQLAWRKTYG